MQPFDPNTSRLPRWHQRGSRRTQGPALHPAAVMQGFRSTPHGRPASGHRELIRPGQSMFPATHFPATPRASHPCLRRAGWSKSPRLRFGAIRRGLSAQFPDGLIEQLHETAHCRLVSVFTVACFRQDDCQPVELLEHPSFPWRKLATTQEERKRSWWRAIDAAAQRLAGTGDWKRNDVCCWCYALHCHSRSPAERLWKSAVSCVTTHGRRCRPSRMPFA